MAPQATRMVKGTCYLFLSILYLNNYRLRVAQRNGWDARGRETDYLGSTGAWLWDAEDPTDSRGIHPRIWWVLATLSILSWFTNSRRLFAILGRRTSGCARRRRFVGTTYNTSPVKVHAGGRTSGCKLTVYTPICFFERPCDVVGLWSLSCHFNSDGPRSQDSELRSRSLVVEVKRKFCCGTTVKDRKNGLPTTCEGVRRAKLSPQFMVKI